MDSWLITTYNSWIPFIIKKKKEKKSHLNGVIRVAH